MTAAEIRAWTMAELDAICDNPTPDADQGAGEQQEASA